MAPTVLRVSARFLGLRAASAAPVTRNLPMPNESIADIQPGVAGCSPGFGLVTHLRPASPNSTTPSTRFPQPTTVERSDSPPPSSPPAVTSSRSTPITVTRISPMTQPRAKVSPLVRARGVARARITATTGIGLSATPTAGGRTSPSTSVHMAHPFPPEGRGCFRFRYTFRYESGRAPANEVCPGSSGGTAADAVAQQQAEPDVEPGTLIPPGLRRADQLPAQKPEGDGLPREPLHVRDQDVDALLAQHGREQRVRMITNHVHRPRRVVHGVEGMAAEDRGAERRPGVGF